jgi:hypothetical protein
MIQEGIDKYVKYGTPFAKNRVILTHTNLVEKVAVWFQFKGKKLLENTLPGVLLQMLKTGTYLPSASWVVPVRQGGMDYKRAAALWKCMISPSTLEMDDICQIFFENTTPGSRLRELGRQQLATDLNGAREGALHDYDVCIEDEVPRAVHDTIITIEDSQEVQRTPQHGVLVDREEVPHTRSTPMYIPVFMQNRDFDHGF